MLPGNHDLNQQSTDESISCYMDEYGYDCFCFHLNNSCFIGLNTPIIFANREEKEKKTTGLVGEKSRELSEM